MNEKVLIRLLRHHVLALNVAQGKMCQHTLKFQW